MLRTMLVGVLVTNLCIGFAIFLGGRGTAQDVKAATPAQDDLQSRIEDLGDYLARFIQEGNPGKAVVFDLVGAKGLRAPFGSWMADQISTTVAQRHPELQVIDRSTISWLLEKRNRDADQGSRAGHVWDPKRDRAYARQAGAETCIFGSFSKMQRAVRIDFYAIGQPKPRSMTFWAILPLTDQVAKLLPLGLETKAPRGESDGASSAHIGEPQCLWCPIQLPATPSNCHGTFALNILVSKEGRATDIQNVGVTEECGERVRAVMEAARRWWFQPAQNLDGKVEAKMFTIRLAL